VISLQRLNG